jgi:low affinity Fe/Cu permease
VLALLCALALTQSPPERVSVGAHLRNVEVINLEENSYFASFVLWVSWRAERDPSKSLRFVNLIEAWALTLTPVYDEPLTLPDGRKYQRFVGEGRFFHKFELAGFPLDTQDIVLELEDTQRSETELVLEADPASSLAADLKVPGWNVRKPLLDVTHVTYPGALGLPSDGAHSRVRFGVTLERPWRVFFITMFPPIALVMMCCWFIFFLRPIHVEARVGTAVTALLTIVFLQLAFTDDLPYLGTTVLLDQVFNFSYAIITAVLAECVVVMRWHDRVVAIESSLPTMPESERAGLDAERRAAREKFERIDARSKWLFPLVYAAGCLAIVATHVR